MTNRKSVNHAGYSCYAFDNATGWTIGEVRTTRDEALADMALMPPGVYAVREAVLLNGKIV